MQPSNGRDGGKEATEVKKEEKRSALESLVSRIRVDAGEDWRGEGRKGDMKIGEPVARRWKRNTEITARMT